jgi:16S rRNA (cytidine1402-2'-O)-methyltransferase
MDNNYGSLFIVSTPIGNLDDITLRAIEVLNNVDICAAEDTRNSKTLFNKYGIKTKLTSYHKFSEKSKALSLIESLKSGLDIALISDAGTPLISDPGKFLLEDAIKNQIKVIPVPGATSVIPALTVSGFDLENFCFYGFFPRQRQAKTRLIKEIASSTKTSVLFESGKRIEQMLNDLTSLLHPSTNLIVARELTKLHETIYRGDLETVKKSIHESEFGTKGEFVVVIEGKIMKQDSEISEEDRRIINILLEELDQKLALEIASKILKKKRNDIYKVKIKK